MSDAASSPVIVPADAPPAIGGRRAPSGRIIRSIAARPALPATNPAASSTTRKTRCAKELWPCLYEVRLELTMPIPCESTSTKMKASTPTENIASATRERFDSRRMRPIGNPR